MERVCLESGYKDGAYELGSLHCYIPYNVQNLIFIVLRTQKYVIKKGPIEKYPLRIILCRSQETQVLIFLRFLYSADIYIGICKKLYKDCYQQVISKSIIINYPSLHKSIKFLLCIRLYPPRPNIEIIRIDRLDSTKSLI